MGVLYPDNNHCSFVGVMLCLSHIILLGVGWLALLILAKGQCEGQRSGIGTEERIPMPFLFPTLNNNINAELGSS